MPSLSRATILPLAFVVYVLLADGIAATPGPTVGESLAAAPQDPSAVEASLALDRSTRRLIQQPLRNEGFDPGAPDGLFGPRTRAAIRGWQEARGLPVTGHLDTAGAELLRAAGEESRSSSRLPASDSNPSSEMAEGPVSPASAAVAAAAQTAGPRQPDIAPVGPPTSHPTGNVQLPPEILVDRHLLRLDRLLADGAYGAALTVVDEIIALQTQHDLVLPHDFHFTYAQVAFGAGMTEAAIASLHDYLLATGRSGDFYRPALDLLDTAEDTLRRAQAEQQRLEAERQRAQARQRSTVELVQRQLAAARPLPRDALRSGGVGPEMVTIPAGRFQYFTYQGRDNLEWIIFDRPFAIAKHEVTRGEFATFVDRTRYRTEARRDPGYGCNGVETARDRRNSSLRWNRPGFAQTDRHPVTCVSIRDALAYTRWLSAETGHSYRLPSAAEWQYAARAGSEEAQLYVPSTDPTSRNSCGRANLDEADGGNFSIACRDGVRYTTEVGRFAPNPVGLHDMIGNVSEMVLACGHLQRNGRSIRLSPDGAPEDPDGCGRYVIAMGGAWYHHAHASPHLARIRSRRRPLGTSAVR